jgi:Lrp/AsnC family leucine-responsive transcriptional regulator
MNIPQLDQIDQKILTALQEDGRLTNVQLAQHVGLSPASTLERVRKLESHKIIKSYHARLAPEKLALRTQVLLQVKLYSLTKENVRAFREAITQIPAVTECHQVVGKADFWLRIVTNDLEAYQDLLMNQLSTIGVIKHMSPCIVTATLKEAGIPVSSVTPNLSP